MSNCRTQDFHFLDAFDRKEKKESSQVYAIIAAHWSIGVFGSEFRGFLLKSSKFFRFLLKFAASSSISLAEKRNFQWDLSSNYSTPKPSNGEITRLRHERTELAARTKSSMTQLAASLVLYGVDFALRDGGRHFKFRWFSRNDSAKETRTRHEPFSW